MRLLNLRFAIPVGSFLLAVGLSWLGGPVTPLIARQAGGATTCTGSAKAISITVAAAGWTFSITDQPINLVNSKTAGIGVSDILTIDVEDVSGTDTNHKKHPFGTITLKVPYNPLPVYVNESIPPPGLTPNAIPGRSRSRRFRPI